MGLLATADGQVRPLLRLPAGLPAVLLPALRGREKRPPVGRRKSRRTRELRYLLRPLATWGAQRQQVEK